MKRFFISTLLLLVSLFIYSQQAMPTDGLLGFYKLDGNSKEADGHIKPGKTQGIKPATDRFGNQGKAISLTYDLRHNKRSFISIPLDISPGKQPLLTISFWIQMNSSNLESGILYQSDNDWSQNDHYRGIYAERDNGLIRWTACCGSDGSLRGTEILAKNWIFIALVYDRDDQAMRLVVNDQVYSKAAKMRDGYPFLRIGPFNGQVDELRIYSRVLTLEELGLLYGKNITKDTSDYVIAKRADYKNRMLREELDKVKLNTTYVVAEDKFPIHDSAGSYNVIAVLVKGDTFRVLQIVKKSALLLLPDGKAGYASISSINGDAYLKGGSYLFHEFKVILGSIFNFTNIRSWFIAVFFAILLYFVVKKYDFIDNLLNRMGRRDPMLQGGSKSEGASSGNILKKIFPLKRMRWWPLTIGAIFALVVFIGLLWDGGEVEWFMNDGFKLIPSGYTRSIHWVLYITFITLIFMYIVMIIESIIVVGPLMAIPRVLILTILMLMALLVTYYLSVLVLIIAIVMLVLFILSSAASGSEYKCPHCNRKFTSSPGSSGSCPYCGGGVST
ncbi:MAG: LamG domain-containing protein [Bacteroidetes bacterium]|nr:LamG domain-containing protein [Bacteroidota bacterium]